MNTLVLEDTENGEMPMDVYQKLANSRILLINDIITDEVATNLVATLILKDHESEDNKITLFLNSPGGDIRNIFMIYDVMSTITAPIEVICMGSVQNEASLLLIGATKGLRFATKNSLISVSQLNNPWRMNTNLTDAKNLMEVFVDDNNRLLNILAKGIGKSIKQVKEDFDRPAYFTAQKALKYGLIDKIMIFNK